MIGSHCLIQGDARRLPLADRIVHCVVTSPPYFGLRDYGTAEWVGGDPECDHRPPNDAPNGNKGQPQVHAGRHSGNCGKCGARRVDRQIGLEPTPDEFVECMVRVFREVKRVLRDDGTCWLNLGDSYVSHGMTGGASSKEHGRRESRFVKGMDKRGTPGIKPKDLIGIPWRVALALQADGWYLRSDIIWAKNNPMPESVTDRPTKSHEYMFLLAKQGRYFYDAEAVREDASERTKGDPRYSGGKAESFAPGYSGNPRVNGGKGNALPMNPSGRNLRSIWTIPTEPYKGAHFAAYPRRLVIPCVKAGTSEKGCCPHCGAPWVRMRLKTRVATRPGTDSKVHGLAAEVIGNRDPLRHVTTSQTIGWRPSCGRDCGRLDCDPVPCRVFDPFNGSGTTGVVALALGRDYIGTDLSAEYLALAKIRLASPGLPISKVAKSETGQSPKARASKPKPAETPGITRQSFAFMDVTSNELAAP